MIILAKCVDSNDISDPFENELRLNKLNLTLKQKVKIDVRRSSSIVGIYLANELKIARK